MKNLLLFPILCLSLINLFAQAPIPGTVPQAPPAANPSPSGNPSSGPTPGTSPAGSGAGVYHQGGFESNTLNGMADRIFDPNSDSIDMENGTFIWKGKGFTFGNDRLLGGRFERYLQTPSSVIEERNKYEEILKTIGKNLSVYEQNGTWEGVMDAWDLLVQAGEYSEYDGGMSLVLGALVYNTWRIRDEFRRNSRYQAELTERKTKLEAIIANRYRHQQLNPVIRTQDQNGTQTVSTDGIVPNDMSEPGFKMKEYAEVNTKIAALNSQKTLTGKEAQIQFQAQLARFLVDRRFKHVLIGANFYRLLFKGTAQQVIEAKDEIAAFFPDTQMTITVDQLAFLAREAINEAETGMTAVENAFRLGNRVTAYKRLQETFFLGEHLSALHSFDDDKRAELFQLKRDMKEARDLTISRAYDDALDVISNIKSKARDAEFRLIEAEIRKAKTASENALFAAIQHRSLGQIDKAEAAFREAAVIWPENPRLRDFQFEGAQMLDKFVQGKQLFDQLLAREDYRGISEKALQFGVALSEDPSRSRKLEEIVKRVTELKIMLQEADAALNLDNPFGAWEILLKADKVDPDDVELNRKKAKIATKVAPFVAELQKADEYEKRRQYAACLQSFLAAQEIYPASMVSNEGIQRVTNALLDELANQRQ